MNAIQSPWLSSIQDAIERKNYIHHMGPTFILSDKRAGRLPLTQIIEKTKRVFNGKLPKHRALESLRKLAIQKRETALLLQRVAIVAACIIPILGWLLLPYFLSCYQKTEDSLLQLTALFAGNEPLGQKTESLPSPAIPIEPRPIVLPESIDVAKEAADLRQRMAKRREEMQSLLKRAAQLTFELPKFTPIPISTRNEPQPFKLDPEMDALVDRVKRMAHNPLPEKNTSPMLGPSCDAPPTAQPTPIPSPDF